MCLSTASDSMHKDVISSSLWMDQYERHNAAVRALVSDDQLLVYRVGEGWERLCQFLGKDVPHEQFPHENRADGEQSQAIQYQYVKFDVFQRANREAALSTVGLTLLSVSLFSVLYNFKF